MDPKTEYPVLDVEKITQLANILYAKLETIRRLNLPLAMSEATRLGLDADMGYLALERLRARGIRRQYVDRNGASPCMANEDEVVAAARDYVQNGGPSEWMKNVQVIWAREGYTPEREAVYTDSSTNFSTHSEDVWTLDQVDSSADPWSPQDLEDVKNLGLGEGVFLQNRGVTVIRID